MGDCQAELRSSSLIIFWEITVIHNNKKDILCYKERLHELWNQVFADKFIIQEKVMQKYMKRINGGVV